MTDRVGRVLDARYRLLALIGHGASAQVYLADDVRLGRQVAVKMLHPMLADDLAFYRRFEAEARRAAALSHPNVVAVYDWGEDAEGPYLVTEYLDGGSLADLLGAGHRLSPSQALLVGLEAARGLAHAHQHGLVHRDVKPANLLFSSDGRLRVADFGVARALAEAALTEPAGATPGTVRYASPEQARGQPVGPPGDVYALALVLVEAVTGAVPFVADTTIGTLMARTESPLTVGDELGPLRGPLEHAGRLDPDARPDAATFATELLAAAEELPAPAPFPLAGRAVSLLDDDPTLVPGAPGMPEVEVPLAAPPTLADVPAAPAPSAATRPVEAVPTGAVPDDVAPAADRPVEVAPAEAAPATRSARRASARGGRRWPYVVVAVVLAAALAAGGVALWFESRVPSYEVPDLVGRQESELNSLIGGYGWKIERREGRRDGSVPGEILEQDPPAGTELEEGGRLVITVSLGQTLAPPPTDLVGLTRDEAVARIEAAGFTVGTVTERHSEDVPAGIVLAVPELPPELEKGTPIDLEVSMGPAPRTIPDDLAGRSFDEAAAILDELGLVAVRVDEPSEEVAEGFVVRTEPAGGNQVARGAEVTVVVSSGPPMVTIPDLRGRTPSEAADVLEGLGLVVAGTRGPPNQNVVSTDPEAGTTVRRGTEVTIITGRDAGGGPGNDDRRGPDPGPGAGPGADD